MLYHGLITGNVLIYHWACKTNLLLFFGGVVDDDSEDVDDEFEPSRPSNHPSDNEDAKLSSTYGSINTVDEACDDVLDNQDAV